MTIVNYFNPESEEHLRAYQDLVRDGVWPGWYYNEIKDMEFPPAWHASIAMKIAGHYIQERLGV